MPWLSEPVAWASAIAASLAEIVSSAVNRSETCRNAQRSSPTMFGDTVVACLLATTMAFGLSAGMRRDRGEHLERAG